MILPWAPGTTRRPEQAKRALLGMAFAGLLAFPALADQQFVRELDAYCVSADGTRSGVAASQDGATNAYVWPPNSDLRITRGVHSRRTVSQWHMMLDRAGFNSLAGSNVSPPYCAIERQERGETHVVRWAPDAVPTQLEAVFKAMLATGASAGSSGR